MLLYIIKWMGFSPYGMGGLVGVQWHSGCGKWCQLVVIDTRNTSLAHLLWLLGWIFLRLVGGLISWQWMFAWLSKGPMIVWTFDDRKGERERERETAWQRTIHRKPRSLSCKECKLKDMSALNSSKYWSRWPRKAFHGWTRICRPGTVQTVVQEVPLVLQSTMKHSRICTRKIH